jgi:hypothetical protein
VRRSELRGRRVVRVPIPQLHAKSSLWDLWHVGATPGRNPEHLFHKLVLSPGGTDLKSKGWTNVGGVSTEEAGTFGAELKKLTDAHCTGKEGTRVHVHIGVMIDAIDTKASAQKAADAQ